MPRTYSELLTRKDGPSGSSWGEWGPDDEIGTLNFLSPESTVAAAKCIRRGVRFNLDHPLDRFDPSIVPYRDVPKHRITKTNAHVRDDAVDGLYPQGSSHMDSLRHFAHPKLGFYNGRTDGDVVVGSPTLGVNRYADWCIAGRGVLVDVERQLAREGKILDHRAGEAFDVGVLERALAHAKLSIGRGDMLVMRTGWLRHYFRELTDAERGDLARDLRSPGLVQAHDTLAWLWDHGISLVASDNAGVEAIPPVKDSPFASAEDRINAAIPRHVGMMHPSMIALLGLAIGELWDLEALAEDCASDGVYEFFLTVKPMNLTGGVGSPANAMAIK
jgi:kynurenine formamidase